MKRIALVFLVVILAAGGSAAQDLERLFKSAVNTETVDRNCKGAIEQYRKVAAGDNRVLAAQALLRMAGCYQQQGDAEAQRIYARILADYQEQTEVVAQARARLASRSPRGPLGDRIVKAGPRVTWGDGQVSPDGRYIPYIDYAVDLEYKVHDLVAGIDRPLRDCAYTSAFSPDGKQLVCGGFGKIGVRIVAMDGSSPPRAVYTNPDVDIFFPSDWSRDGKSIALVARRLDRTRQIGVLNVEDRSFKVLKTVGWQGPNRVFFSPDGRSLAYDLPASDTDTQRDVFVMAVDGSGERRATSHAADDVAMAWSPDGRNLLFASNRNGPVGLWAQPMIDGRTAPVGPTLVKADIGTVDSLGMTRSGTLFVLKNASTVNLQIAPIDLTAGKVTGSPRVQIYGSDTPDWSPDGTKIAYSKTTATGQRRLAIHELASNTVRELRPQLLYMPMPRWFPDGRSLVVWGRDLNGKGVIVRIDAETGQETHITDAYDIQQVHVSPDGRRIYHSDDNNRGPAATNRGFFERDLTTGAIRTLDQRGALSPDGRLLARVSVDDKSKTSTIVIVPVKGGEARRLIVPVPVQGFRGSSWMPDSQGLLFAETSDNAKARSLWLVPAAGGSPRRLDIDISSWIVGQGVRLSPDGKQIAYFTGEDSREVWALENVIPSASK